MFGKKNTKGGSAHNILLLDIENASVGVALAHLHKGAAPVLFAEHRTHLSIPQTLRGAGIAAQIEKATHQALERIGLVAAKLRSNPSTAQRGDASPGQVRQAGAPEAVSDAGASLPGETHPPPASRHHSGGQDHRYGNQSRSGAQEERGWHLER